MDIMKNQTCQNTVKTEIATHPQTHTFDFTIRIVYDIPID